MRQFLNLNRHKLKFAFKAASLIFSTLILAVFLIAYFNEGPAEIDAIVFGLFLFGIVLPCFIIFISYLAWDYKQRAKRKAFSKSPFDQLHELGFSDSLLNENSKWSFTEKSLKQVTLMVLGSLQTYCTTKVTLSKSGLLQHGDKLTRMSIKD
jgi:hypothetical protein